MMPKWSRLHGACLNCGTQRRPHYSKGFCKPCHVMMKRIWAAEKWDLKHPETLTNMPSHPMWTRDAIVAGLADREWSQAEFERCRCEYIRQYRERLTLLHCSEKRRRQRVTGWDVEGALRLVHAYIRPKSAARPYSNNVCFLQRKNIAKRHLKTCRGVLTMSVHRGRPEVTGTRSK